MNATSNEAITVSESVTVLLTGGSFHTETGVLLGYQ